MIISGLIKTTFTDFGSKVACIIFTCGCNFKCPFCHNSSLALGSAPSISEDEVFTFLKRRVGILDGVVISGGEPTIHKDLKQFIKKVKDLGYLVKLDTNGSNPTMLQELIDEKLIDYVAMDIKNDKDGYDRICGCHVPFDKVSKSIEILLKDQIDYEFRTTLVKEYFTKDTIVNISSLIKGAKHYYLQKFEDNDNCIQDSLNEISLEEAKSYLPILEKTISHVELRGY